MHAWGVMHAWLRTVQWLPLKELWMTHQNMYFILLIYDIKCNVQLITLHTSCGEVYCNRPCLCVCGWVCCHDNSKLRASILTKLGSSSPSHAAPRERGSEVGRNVWLRVATASVQCLCLIWALSSLKTVILQCKFKFGNMLCFFVAVSRRYGSVRFTSYDATRTNMFINKSSKVICQGFTGKQVFNQ